MFLSIFSPSGAGQSPQPQAPKSPKSLKSPGAKNPKPQEPKFEEWEEAADGIQWHLDVWRGTILESAFWSGGRRYSCKLSDLDGVSLVELSDDLSPSDWTKAVAALSLGRTCVTIPFTANDNAHLGALKGKRLFVHMRLTRGRRQEQRTVLARLAMRREGTRDPPPCTTCGSTVGAALEDSGSFSACSGPASRAEASRKETRGGRQDSARKALALVRPQPPLPLGLWSFCAGKAVAHQRNLSMSQGMRGHESDLSADLSLDLPEPSPRTPFAALAPGSRTPGTPAEGRTASTPKSPLTPRTPTSPSPASPSGAPTTDGARPWRRRSLGATEKEGSGKGSRHGALEVSRMRRVFEPGALPGHTQSGSEGCRKLPVELSLVVPQDPALQDDTGGFEAFWSVSASQTPRGRQRNSGGEQRRNSGGAPGLPSPKSGLKEFPRDSTMSKPETTVHSPEELNHHAWDGLEPSPRRTGKKGSNKGDEAGPFAGNPRFGATKESRHKSLDKVGVLTAPCAKEGQQSPERVRMKKELASRETEVNEAEGEKTRKHRALRLFGKSKSSKEASLTALVEPWLEASAKAQLPRSRSARSAGELDTGLVEAGKAGSRLAPRTSPRGLPAVGREWQEELDRRASRKEHRRSRSARVCREFADAGGYSSDKEEVEEHWEGCGVINSGSDTDGVEGGEEGENGRSRGGTLGGRGSRGRTREGKSEGKSERQRERKSKSRSRSRGKSVDARRLRRMRSARGAREGPGEVQGNFRESEERPDERRLDDWLWQSVASLAEMLGDAAGEEDEDMCGGSTGGPGEGRRGRVVGDHSVDEATLGDGVGNQGVVLERMLRLGEDVFVYAGDELAVGRGGSEPPGTGEGDPVWTTGSKLRTSPVRSGVPGVCRAVASPRTPLHADPGAGEPGCSLQPGAPQVPKRPQLRLATKLTVGVVSEQGSAEEDELLQAHAGASVSPRALRLYAQSNGGTGIPSTAGAGCFVAEELPGQAAASEHSDSDALLCSLVEIPLETAHCGEIHGTPLVNQLQRSATERIQRTTWQADIEPVRGGQPVDMVGVTVPKVGPRFEVRKAAERARQGPQENSGADKPKVHRGTVEPPGLGHAADQALLNASTSASGPWAALAEHTSLEPHIRSGTGAHAVPGEALRQTKSFRTACRAPHSPSPPLHVPLWERLGLPQSPTTPTVLKPRASELPRLPPSTRQPVPKAPGAPLSPRQALPRPPVSPSAPHSSFDLKPRREEPPPLVIDTTQRLVRREGAVPPGPEVALQGNESQSGGGLVARRPRPEKGRGSHATRSPRDAWPAKALAPIVWGDAARGEHAVASGSSVPRSKSTSDNRGQVDVGGLGKVAEPIGGREGRGKQGRGMGAGLNTAEGRERETPASVHDAASKQASTQQDKQSSGSRGAQYSVSGTRNAVVVISQTKVAQRASTKDPARTLAHVLSREADEAALVKVSAPAASKVKKASATRGLFPLRASKSLKDKGKGEKYLS